jgi:glycosyltransferase involved in cell wall biosynthesis
MNKNVIFYQSRIAPFRINLFNQLSIKHKSITFASLSRPDEEIKFKLLLFRRKTFLGLYFMSLDFFKYLSKFDIIVLEFNIRYFQFLFLKLFFPKKKIILWGIGVSSDNGFDKSNYLLDLVRLAFMFSATEIIFYSEYPRLKYYRFSKIVKKLKVSGNCNLDNVPTVGSSTIRKNLLFIGTFKKNKGFEQIIDLINRIKLFFHDKVIVIGSGELELTYKKRINELNLQNYFEFKGKLDININYDYVMRSCFLTILPGQAGLSVIDSLKMGIPVITKYNSITGGERFYIQNNFNGFFYEENNELDYIVLKLYNDQEYSRTLSFNAITYINSVTSIEHMSQVFIRSFKS